MTPAFGCNEIGIAVCPKRQRGRWAVRKEKKPDHPATSPQEVDRTMSIERHSCSYEKAMTGCWRAVHVGFSSVSSIELTAPLFAMNAARSLNAYHLCRPISCAGSGRCWYHQLRTVFGARFSNNAASCSETHSPARPTSLICMPCWRARVANCAVGSSGVFGFSENPSCAASSCARRCSSAASCALISANDELITGPLPPRAYP